MLKELRIQEYALFDQLHLDFYSGESVVTGETGSGKSIFVDALHFLAGSRSDQRIRKSAQPALVEGVFFLAAMEKKSQQVQAFLESLGLAKQEAGEDLIVRRELGDRGSRQWINDSPVTLQSLRELLSFLIDIHTQNAQSYLKNPKTYLPLLDSFLGEPAEVEKEALSQGLKKKRALEKSLEALDLSPEELERQLDLLSYQKKEIEEADLDHLDEEELDKEYRALSSAEDRLQAASAILQSLNGSSHGMKYGLQSLAVAMDDLVQKDPSLRETKDLFWQMDAEMESVISDLRQYLDLVTVDPERIQALDALFRLLQKLKRKYGSSLEEIKAYYDRILVQLDQLGHVEKNRAKLEGELAKVDQELEKRAQALHLLRQEAAKVLEGKIKAEMEEMAIKNMDFAIAFSRADAISRQGFDQIDFLISTNLGEALQPLSQVASGGELSRFMLALKIIASDLSAMPTIVFDEIDVGISGRTAQVVGEKIRKLARSHQIIIISHLPQIAAMANEHYLVKKESKEGETLSEIRRLDQSGRLDELSRLIGGVKITELTRQNAEQMLRQAQGLASQGKDSL